MLLKNKKAVFNYKIQEEYIAGLKLKGYEVKSLRKKQGSLSGSYVSFNNGESFIKNLNISKYSFASIKDYDPLRPRKLLLTKKQIEYLNSKNNEKGTTIIPLEIFLKNNIIKVKIGVCIGKKLYDKRETLKKRSIDIEISRTLKSYK